MLRSPMNASALTASSARMVETSAIDVDLFEFCPNERSP
jgi:hypothetical protein